MADDDVTFQGSELQVGTDAGEPSAPAPAVARPSVEDEPNVGEDVDQVYPDDLSAREQAEMRAAEEEFNARQAAQMDRSEEDSLAKASFNIDLHQEWSSRCDLYRKDPKEHKGIKIGGFVRRFEHPFDIADIQHWARKHRGGGTFEMVLYDGRGVIRRRKTFECEGRVILPDEVPDESDAPATKNDGPSAATLEAQQELAQMREEMQRRDFQHQLEQQRQATERMFREQNDRFAQLLEKVTEKEPEPKKGITDMAESFGPLILGFLEKQREDQNRRDDIRREEQQRRDDLAREERQAAREAAERAEKRHADLMKATMGKKESLADSIKAMADLKKLTGGDNTEAKAFNKLIDVALPKLIDATTRIQMHKAGVPADGEEEEFGAKMVLDRLTDMASGYFASRGGEGGQPMIGHAPQPGQPAPQAVTTQPGVGIPVRRHQGTGQPLVTPEQQAALEQQQAAAAAATGDPNAVVQAPPNQAVPEINLRLFDRALEYMNEGKSGAEFADDIITEEEENYERDNSAPHLYLAPKIVRLIHEQEPDVILNLLRPHIEARPQYHALLDVVGQSFMRSFCQFIVELGEDLEEEDGPETDGDETEQLPEAAPAAAPAAPTTEVQPDPDADLVEGDVDDITGGIGPDEGAQA